MRITLAATALALLTLSALPASARSTACGDLPNYATFKAALKEATAQKNGGFSLPMWGTVVDRSGIVCLVAYSGDTVDAQWPGSRVISAQKANTANAFSLTSFALSTANLYSATQPGGSMFGLQDSNPINISAAYSGDVAFYGSETDPMVKSRIGGVNVFGGGLALYSDQGEIIGGIGVSGDSSCADHNIAWRIRNALKLDYVPAGVAADKTDQIIYDVVNGKSAGGWGHAACAGAEKDMIATLPPVSQLKTK